VNSAITQWPVISNKIYQQLHISYVWTIITECIKLTPVVRDSLPHCLRHHDADCNHYVCLCTDTNSVTVCCASESLFARYDICLSQQRVELQLRVAVIPVGNSASVVSVHLYSQTLCQVAHTDCTVVCWSKVQWYLG